MRRPNTKCDLCEKPFYKRPKLLSETQHNYCSVKCYRTVTARKNKICEMCGGQMNSHSDSAAKFCSRVCANKARTNTKYDGSKCKSRTVLYKKVRITLTELYGYICSECGNNGFWNNKILKLQIDHIDGNRGNNLIENLRFLCPNCHSQTNTYAVQKHRLVK